MEIKNPLFSLNTDHIWIELFTDLTLDFFIRHAKTPD
jgi:hypothetical protein